MLKRVFGDFSSAVDLEKINNWLIDLLQAQEVNIFRRKCILNVAGEEDRLSSKELTGSLMVD